MISNAVTLSKESLSKYAKWAKEYKKSQTRDDVGMKDVELAGDELMASIEIVDLADALILGISKDFQKFDHVLASRYNVIKPKTRIDGSITDPKIALHKTVAASYKAGVRNFYISIMAHGSSGAMSFGSNELKPADITSIMKEFPKARFTLNAISCFGGGMAEEMARFRDVSDAAKNRILAITQTKGDVVNYAHTSEEDYITKYNAALAVNLMKGVDGRPGERVTYGQAHLLADTFAKAANFTDAEVYGSNPGANSSRTAGMMVGDLKYFEGMA
jgi:hypothetical protein